MSASFPDITALGDTVAGFNPFDLYAGEAPVVTQSLTVASGLNLAQFTVVAMNTANEVVALDPTVDYIADTDTVAGGTVVDLKLYTSKPIGVLAYAINTTGGAAKATVFTSGFFNADVLVWPASLDTLAKRQAAVIGSPISVGTVQRDA
jgi:hypothetical protein